MNNTLRNWLAAATGLLIICCLLAGCQEKEELIKCDSLPIMPDEPPFSRPEVSDVGVYLDVTLSMEGFLGMNSDSYRKVVPETVYMQCLDEVNELISGMFDVEDVTYYRVDTPTWKTEENVLEKAKLRGYYSDTRNRDGVYELVDLIEKDGEGPECWCITNALLSCKNHDFSVFITDFYENRRMASEVITALKQMMDGSGTPGDKTVGIIGIRSQFAGKVYDFDIGREGVEYGIVEGDVSEEDICYRQFFVITVGFPEDIQEFCGRLMENMNLGQEDIKCTIFYEEQMYGLDYADFHQCYTRNNESSDWLWEIGDVVINDDIKARIYDYSHKSAAGRDIVVSYKVEGASLQRELQKGRKVLLMLPDVGEMELHEVSYYIEEKKAFMWQEGNSDGEQKNYEEVYRIENICYSPDEELLYVWFKVLKKDDVPSSILKLSCQVHLKRQGSLDDEWIDEWHIYDNEKDYGKTKNLKDFFLALREEMPKVNSVLLEFVFYLNY